MAERERKKTIMVYLNDKEMELLEMRCREVKESKSQVIRELIVFGFTFYVDYEKLKDVSKELNAIGKNINQIAARVNTTDNIYKEDIADIQKEMKEIWRSLRSTLSGQVFRKQ